MIFILTFNLVVVSDLREKQVIVIAKERLATVGIGFAICIFTSLFVFPNWASDELHDSVTSKFEDVASSIEGTTLIKFPADSLPRILGCPPLLLFSQLVIECKFLRLSVKRVLGGALLGRKREGKAGK